VYRPNPAAIVVAIDPGHGGCLDWGVPNPYDNKVTKSEKTDTLAIALALRDLLTAQGITVVLTHDTDSALTGEDYPALGCHGPPFRDVNGDGLRGFGPKVPPNTLTRDEVSARIDVANLARADLAISIHINSMTQNGVLYKIAATQSFFCDALPWADESDRLSRAVQGGVVRSMAAATSWHRQDRGVDGTPQYLYFVKPAGQAANEPRRGLLMPAVLTEVGSMSLPAESQLLATSAGRTAAAQGVYDGIVAYLANRPVAGRIDGVFQGGGAGSVPGAAPGIGPPYWAPVVTPGPLTLRVTNTGTQAWPAGMSLAGGWQATAAPYLSHAPSSEMALGAKLPALAPGASVEVSVNLPPPAATDRQVAWISLVAPDGTALAQMGSPALQVASRAP
jgi:N-acetylmuramoyl-L-alanine amidase